MVLAGIAAVTMVIGIVRPGKDGRNKKASGTRSAPEVSVPDFGDYRGRAGSPEPARELSEFPEDEEPPPPYLPPPPPQQRQQQQQQQPPPSGQGRNLAAEAEYAARASSLVPAVQGRLAGLQAEYPPAQYVPEGPLSPEDYIQGRLAALAPSLYGSAGTPAAPPPAGTESGTPYE